MPQWTSLGARQLATFFDPANTANTFSPQTNYVAEPIKPGSVRKYTQTVNGTSVIIGDREYPPVEIKLVWDQMDISDFTILRQFTIISPIVFIDHNDNGYLGVLVINNAQQVRGLTKNVWGIDASFLVIAPYNGKIKTINLLTPPALSQTNASTGGYLNQSTGFYFWATVTTPWGQSLVGPSYNFGTAASGTTTNTITVTWTQPTSVYFKKLKLYWNTVNNPVTATQLTEVQAGFAGSFTIYSPYVAYSTINPPTYSTAYSGYWSGGQFTSV